MLKTLVLLSALVAVGLCWSGILIPAENEEYPGQVFSASPYMTVGMDRDNFGNNSSSMADVSVASCNNLVYVTGGRDGVNATQGSTRVMVYDVSSGRMKHHNHFNLTTKRWSHSSVCITSHGGSRHQLYLFGGACDTFSTCRTASAEVCDSFHRNCTPIADMPAPLDGVNQRAVAAFGRIFVAGGYGYNIKGLISYHPQSDNWTILAVGCVRDSGMSEARAEFGFAELNGRLIACGGWVKAQKKKNPGKTTCEAYSPIEDQWSSIAKLNQGRMRMGMVNLNGRLFGFGGLSTAVGYGSDTIEEYIDDVDEWVLLDTKLRQKIVFAETAVGVTTAICMLVMLTTNDYCTAAVADSDAIAAGAKMAWMKSLNLCKIQDLGSNGKFIQACAYKFKQVCLGQDCNTMCKSLLVEFGDKVPAMDCGALPAPTKKPKYNLRHLVKLV